MKKIIIKYNGYNAELTPIKNSCSNYNTMLHVLKGKKFLAGVSVKDCTPINEIIAEIERLTTTLEK